ncbi:hypothetical protein HED55_00360 [Ochrobactrum haematophilum]|uniref:Uncharacterized protein n=1 Tax=Brucella haematophila TaxID=419474 RepID=A0ABX1DHE5_9HYPH|nr:hypothetical protein [Brucella haematophila]
MKNIKDRLFHYSTKVNGVLVPISALDSALAAFSTNLVVLTGHETYPISLIGSATCLHWHDKYFVVCTRHQINGLELSKIGMLCPDGNVITSGGAKHFIEINDGDFHDLCAFDFTEPCKSLPRLQSRFYNVGVAPPDAPYDEFAFAQVSGFPTELQNYDMDASHIGTVKAKVIVQLDRPSNDQAVITLRPLENMSFEPDGLSGLSVFIVHASRPNPTAYFAGIVTRASKSFVYAVKAGWILNFLAHFG